MKESFSCPLPIGNYKTIVLAHGGGGKLMHQLLQNIIYPAFKNTTLDQQHDGAVLNVDGAKIAFTTDSYVVNPLFFPGGDIGKLAVFGTVNDLAMCGAKPRWLSAAIIIEEGFPIETLIRIVDSMQKAAKLVGIEFVTGDTKVVDKGKGDGIFINTSGIGLIEKDIKISPKNVKPGDVVIVNGDLGRHGMAIMSVREGLEFESPIISDCAPLWDIVEDLLANDIEIRCLRDLTRGGLASALNEIAVASQIQIDIDESAVPVSDHVKAACEILGLDPLYVANEGRMIVIVPENCAQKTLEIMRANENSCGATIIGKATSENPGMVTRLSPIGTKRILDMLSGEQLPRIC
ncbi:MAG: hydrogenase expression/formation protein HypE [Verrucomicrobiae bacterium]|nr:hydrogenase expression/formation protein HypE [Verrucomicrobiae bacterium]